MKKALSVVAMLLITAVMGHEFSGHNFLSIPAPYRSGTPERESFTRGQALYREGDEWGFSCAATLFGGGSLNPKGITRYFLPYNKISLLVTEDGAAGVENRDVAASHLNIETVDNTFKSKLTFDPTYDYIGLGCTFRQRIIADECGITKWWLELSFPFMKVTTGMGMKEQIFDDGGGAVDALGLDNAPRVGNAAQAFRQSSWIGGKIFGTQKHSACGIADVELKIGYNSLEAECYHLRSYVGIIIPTGNRVTSQIVFEPMVGNNHHAGVMWGSNMGLQVWQCGDQTLYFEIDTCIQYLFSNHQIRSFDMKDTTWSRYMESYSSPDAARQAKADLNPRSGTSGVNLYTTCVRIFPHIQSTSLATFIYNNRFFSGELGYMIYSRQAESVDLNFKRGPAFKHVEGLGKTTFARTIKYDFAAVAEEPTNYQELNQRWVNQASIAQPTTLTSIIYLALGYQPESCPFFIGSGASYEFSTINVSIDRWMVWLKGGYEF